MKNEIIDLVIQRIVKDNGENWAMNIHAFDWVPGVGLYGIYRAWQYTGRKDYKVFLEKWVDQHLREAYSQKTVNSTAPMSTVLSLYEENNREEYLKVCVDIAEYIVNEAPRTREGGFEHTVTEDVPGFKEQIWADTLFMVCIFLARLGKATGEMKYLMEAGKQLEIHHQVLKDKSTGLFYHGWNCEQKHWMSGALWARANAWITASTVEILDLLPKDYEGRERLIKSLLEQVNALKEMQHSDGMFGTLLDHADTYGESSATAGIAYGIKRGIASGYLPKEYREVWEKAEKAVMGKINGLGEVEDVSTGTPVMPTLEDYKKIELCPTLYGQGLALLLLCS